MTGNISLLLGAGISIPAGLPSTGDITNSLLNGNYCPPQDFTYDYDKEDLELIIKYLKLIYSKIEAFYQGRPINYEDIYYVTSQIKDFLIEYENPVVSNFADEILDQLSVYRQKGYPVKRYELMNEDKVSQRKSVMISSGQSNEKLELLRGNKLLTRVANLAAYYINDLTKKSLQIENINTDHLDFIKEIVLDETIDKINIFTLNHDTLIERYLKAQELDYYDGFINYADGFSSNDDFEKKRCENYNHIRVRQENFDENLRVWQPDFINFPGRIRLLKLHGSIDWYKFKRKNIKNYPAYFFAQVENSMGSKDLFDSKNIIVESRPLILTGRFNKILEYNRSIYVDLHYYFYQLLPTASILLISGYSFNDKGINSWLIDWMYSRYMHRIIFIHPRPEECIKKARVGIKDHWNIWEQEGKIKTIPTAIEEFSWRECRDL
ncbi:MAG: SIR2 family protein [Halanaerobiales bacterium]